MWHILRYRYEIIFKQIPSDYVVKTEINQIRIFSPKGARIEVAFQFEANKKAVSYKGVFYVIAAKENNRWLIERKTKSNWSFLYSM